MLRGILTHRHLAAQADMMQAKACSRLCGRLGRAGVIRAGFLSAETLRGSAPLFGGDSNLARIVSVSVFLSSILVRS